MFYWLMRFGLPCVRYERKGEKENYLDWRGEGMVEALRRLDGEGVCAMKLALQGLLVFLYSSLGFVMFVWKLNTYLLFFFSVNLAYMLMLPFFVAMCWMPVLPYWLALRCFFVSSLFALLWAGLCLVVEMPYDDANLRARGFGNWYACLCWLSCLDNFV